MLKELGKDVAARSLCRLHDEICRSPTSGIFCKQNEGLKSGEVFVVGHFGEG